MNGDERELLAQAFAAGRAVLGDREGFRRVIELALSSPQFLYRFEVGKPIAGSGVTPLTTWELATRLSYLIWVSAPDVTLYRAAWDDQLTTPEGLERVAEVMMRDPRAMRGRISFLQRWLDPSAVRLVTKPPEASLFTIQLRDMLITSAHRTFAQKAWESDQRSLFTAMDLWADGKMAEVYQLWAPSFGEGLVGPMGDQKRFGILTYPAFLASLANGEETSPVARGVLFVEEVLCTELPEPPANIAAVAPAEARMGATMRDRLAEHTNNPACSVCHQLFDPVGLGLENYDGYGMWRTADSNGHLIDASGRLLGKDFAGPEQLAELLGESPKVTDCLVKQWFRYAFGRDPLPTDDCTLQQLKGNFERNGRSLDALLRATIKTDAFRTRTVTGGGP